MRPESYLKHVLVAVHLASICSSGDRAVTEGCLQCGKHTPALGVLVEHWLAEGGLC